VHISILNNIKPKLKPKPRHKLKGVTIGARSPKKIFFENFCKKYIARGNFMRKIRFRSFPNCEKASLTLSQGRNQCVSFVCSDLVLVTNQISFL
jgi:hypothetical protein